MLTQDQVRTELHYDPDTGLFTRRVARCNKVKVGDVAGGVSSKGEVQIRVRGRLYLAHQLAWVYMTGVWPKHEIDHKDLDRTRNAWDNLRAATDEQQQANTGARWHNKLGVKNVVQRNGRFRLRMMIDGKRTHVGYFDTVDAAEAKHAELAVLHHGEFARVA